MSRLHALAELGQAAWLDYIRRSFIASGELEESIENGIRGVTSNPTIFDQAIAGSNDYDADLRALVDAGKAVDAIYEALTSEDIRQAADVLRPVFEQTGRADGYVSLEVSPRLAYDTNRTLTEARRLFAAISRPNVMIKVPATDEGIPAIERLIAHGININVTLIFSLAQYEAVAYAYIAGLERLAEAGGDLSQVASVASFFISRIDGALDDRLVKAGAPDLRGKIAIASAKVAYARFRAIFKGDRWERLAARGARVQRVLWASTSTKDPTYPDTLYVDSLIGPDTVNTIPPATLQAFLDHGSAIPTVGRDLETARTQLNQLTALGIDLDAVTRRLLQEGVDKFAQSFDSLLQSITRKRDHLLAGRQQHAAHLVHYQGRVDTALAGMERERILARIWQHDHTVWQPDAQEIANRLGWLSIAQVMADNTHRLESLAADLRDGEFTHALLLGMGGSSLAPEVFRHTFGVKPGYLDLAVLDSTDPASVLAQTERLDPAHTIFIVSTKSGTTAETLSFFKFFYNWVTAALGPNKAGEHFIAITDPGSPLVDLADGFRFRVTFLNDANIGGRYSALSYFGLVPAALIGMDVDGLLQRAMEAASNSASCLTARDNKGAWLGTILGELAKGGRDKATFVLSPPIAAFGSWVEQLIAESTGKSATGILPVVTETLGAPDTYGQDRLFIYLRLDNDSSHDAAFRAIEEAGHPTIYLHLRDLYDLGGQLFAWEMATAVAGHHLGIHPFNQPDVESAKVRAREMIAAFRKTGRLPDEDPTMTDAGISVYGNGPAASVEEALRGFLDQRRAGDYVALQAYVQPTPESDAALRSLGTRLRDRYQLATTVGFGPRYLHSTGQLHKGDRGNGLFIQFTCDDPLDLPIPDEAGSPASSLTFGALKAAQALGDRSALMDAGRRVIRFHLGTDIIGGIHRLAKVVE